MSLISDYLRDVREAICALPEESIQDVVDILKKAHADGKQVFLLGNGGSSANSTHIAEDLQKGVKEHTGKRFKVISLTESTPLITAWANDAGYERVFVEQIESLLDPGDVVIAISGSGNSPNVLRAVEKANEMGAITIGWSGMGGGKLAQIAQKSI
ncbi:MAG: D-sedoheptulose-7-phosphate isomerase, partial [Armatimonadota bacterium]